MNRAPRLAGVAGCLLAGLGVVLGAFGAHALRDRLGADAMAIWQTAVQYQFLHAIGLVLAAAISSRRAGRAATFSSLAFLAGIVFFSGSLYALALGAPRGLGMLTPVGGVAFVFGWIALAFSIARADSPLP